MSIGGTVYYKRQDIGCLLATGRDRLDLLHRLSTNDLLSLTPGTGTITVLTSDKGRIVDLLTVYCFADHLLLLCSSGNQDTVLRYLDKYTITEDFTINDISAKFKIYSILGDNAKNTLTECIDAVGIKELSPFSYIQTEKDVLIARGAWYNGDGYNIIAPKEQAESVEETFISSGFAALSRSDYEALRIETGVPAFGNELNDSHNPLEAELESAVSFTKGCYIGQEVIARLHSYNKVQRKLCRVEGDAAGSVSAPALLTDGEKEIGTLTSAAIAPTTGKMIGLCYLPIGWQREKPLMITIEGKEYPLRIIV